MTVLSVTISATTAYVRGFIRIKKKTKTLNFDVSVFSNNVYTHKRNTIVNMCRIPIGEPKHK